MNNFKSISTIEASVLEHITKNGKVSRKQLIEDLKISDTSVDIVVNKLINTNVIKEDENSVLQYIVPLKDDVVILDGQLLLPVAVIDEGETKIISRGGKWYRFPKDFDIRRIIWNVDMVENNGNEKNSSLVDLLKSTIVKTRKSSIVQLEEYLNLVNKIVPYNEDIGLHLLKIGSDETDIHIIFKIKLRTPDGIEGTYKGFSARSVISTVELIGEINKDPDDRNYDNIRVDHQIDLNDTLFLNNEFPIAFYKDMKATVKEEGQRISGTVLKVAKITKIKNSLELNIITRNAFGDNKVIQTLTYDSISEGIEYILNESKPLIDLLFRKNDFILETI